MATLGILAIAVAAGIGDLPVGMVAEPTSLMMLLRTIAFAWALVMLLFGVRIGRGVVGTLLLAVGLAVGLWMVGSFFLLLAGAIAVVVVAVGMAMYLLLPRLAMAVALVWPLPALYVAHLYFSGSFDRRPAIAIGLAVAGFLLGVLFPRRSLAVLSAALGTILFFVAGPFEASFALVLAIAGVSVAWQLVVVGGRRMPESQVPDPGGRLEPTRWARWLGSVRWATVVVAAGLLAVAFLAPGYGVADADDPQRLRRLAVDGGFGRPGLVASTLNNYYLSGRSLPIAVVGERSGILTRLWFAVAGYDLSGSVRELRRIKDEGELEKMRRAAAITSRAFTEIHPLIAPGVNEGEIETAILAAYRAHGATGVAFDSIVGSGANAVLPHYDRNDSEMRDGLVVIDIGCSVDGYASDMTRTFAVSGEYTEAQRHLIDTVITAGDAARAVLEPGVTMSDVDAAARAVIDEAGFGEYFTHGVGHPVGLNVHDPWSDPLQAGMVLTIEPGIYIPEGADVEPEYWNLGVRIEDTYIVTESGWEEITDYPRRPYPVEDPSESEEPEPSQVTPAAAPL